MKRFLLIILWMIAAILPSWAAKGYEMEVRNLVQVNESEFTFEVRMKKTLLSDPFAIEAIQWQLSFNTAMMNGGSLNNTYLTYIDGTTDLAGVDIIPKSANFSTNQVVIQWVTASLDNGGQTTLFNDDNWKRIGTFRVQLRNSGNTAFHNFADVAHSLAFVPSQVIVNWCNYTTSGGLYYRDGAYFEIISDKTLTNSLASRELAGYCFTGTGNYSATARWNNVSTSNANTVPTSSNNAIIAGAATVSDTRVAKDVTVASGGYLVVAPGGKYTTNNLYNDNTGSGGGTATIAKWDFQLATVGTQNPYPYTADDGIAANKSIAPCGLYSATLGNYFNFSSSGGTIAIRGSVWFDELDELYGYWRVQLSTAGYSSLKINSKQYSTVSGPKSFKLQYSLNGSTWNDITDGNITVATNWTIGVVTNLSLPSALDNQSTVYIRWYSTDNVNYSGTNAIDDILITGTALPTGINIQSSTGGATGSLIHNNEGVEATVERYIAGNINAYEGWHFLSSPVAAQPISDFHTAGSGDDFYKWDETAPDSKKWINRTAIGGGLNGSFEANFVPGRGYLVAFRENSTKSFTGDLNVTGNSYTGLTYTPGTYYPGWHLLGNPFASALKFNQGNWNRTNVSSIAQIWRESTASYKVLTTAMEIPAMNGFMVYTTGNGSLTIPADARIHSDSLWYKQAQSAESIVLVADDQEGGTSQETIIRVDPASTEGYDFDLDSYYLAGFAPAFYSKSLGKNYALSTLPALENSMVIPLGFVKNDYSLFSIRLDRNISGVRPVLRDLKLNIDQDLSVYPVYHFSSETGDNANRFELRFASVGMNEMASRPVAIYSNGKTIYIESKSGSSLQGSATVYNMLGQELKSLPLSETPLTAITLDVHHSGLIVKVLLDHQVYSGKVFVK